MKFTHSAAALCASSIIGSLLSGASASVIIVGSPQGVSPTSIESQPDVGDADIVIGTIRNINGVPFEVPGELTVNAEGALTSISTNRNIEIGNLEATSGILNVFGNGSAGSASATARGLFVSGYDGGFSEAGGTGVLNISNGGNVTILGASGGSDFGSAFIGFAQTNDTPQDGNGAGNTDGIVNVDGLNSTLGTGQLTLGNNLVGPTGELNVTGGAKVVANTQFESGGMIFQNGALNVYENSTVNVDGAGSEISTQSLTLGFRNLSPLSQTPQIAPGQLNITNGGRVEVISDGSNFLNADIGAGGDGHVFVSGAGSELFVDVNVPAASPAGIKQYALTIGRLSNFEDDPQTSERVYATGDGLLRVEDNANVTVMGDVSIGGEVVFADFPGFEDAPNSKGVLDVRSGGEMIADNIFVFEEGRLQGDGGSITANVIVDGGSIAPGNSPGMMSIDGDLTFATAASLLEIEIAGLADGEFDVLEITGDLFAENGFTLELSFLDGFTPEIGDSFDFLKVGGISTLDFAMVNVITNGLIGDYDFGFNALNGVFSLTALSVPDVSDVPIPGALVFMLSGLAGLGFARKRRSQRS